MLQVPLPVPVTVLLPFNVNVHAPLAVIVPLMDVLPPLHIVVALLVIAATGRALTVMAVLPVRSADIELQIASVKEAMV